MADTYTIILAPNPSIMTGPGTNTIVLGEGSDGATVIDPAVDDASYLASLVQEGERRGGIKRILITHGHSDHTSGAVALRERTHAPIYAFSRESVLFADELLVEGKTIPAGTDTLSTLYTPGHRFDHVCFFLDRARILFAGDIVAGMGTVVIAPPEGDMLDYLNSLARLKSLHLKEIVPAHGPVIDEPRAKLAEYIDHRLQREQQVIALLETSSHSNIPGMTVPTMVAIIYADVDPALHQMAALSILAHLLKLEREHLVQRVAISGEDFWSLIRP
jgi:glyoxylase-like metal-dependent hydrolase (beta-lactamase superfamily II)